MARTVIGYDSEGRKLWGPNEPATWVAYNRVPGGHAIEARVYRSPDLPRPRVVRDYQASIAKGHATRRLRGTT